MAKLSLVAGLVAVTVSSLWFARAGDRSAPEPVASFTAPQEVERASVEREGSRSGASAGVSLDRAGDRFRTSQVPFPTQGLDPIRAIRADGTPVPGAMGVFVPADGDPSVFTFDEAGLAVLPPGDRGLVYATAPGLCNARLDLEESPESRSLVLHDARVVSGVITVDGFPPGEKLRLKRFLGNREVGIRAGDSSVRKVLEEGGFLPEELRLTSLPTGAFELKLSWLLGTVDRPELEFACPPAFLVRAVNGAPVTGDRTEIAFPPEANEVHIELERLPAVRGRLRWGDTAEPVLGGIVHQRLDSQGKTMDGMPYLELDEEGGFLVPAVGIPRNGRTERGSLATTLVLHVRDPAGASGTQFRFSLAGQDLPWDLGDLEVERIVPLPVLVRGKRADGSYRPLRAGLLGPDSSARTESDGTGSILLRPGQTLEVLSAGWHYRQVPVPQGLYTEESPLVIDLEPAPLLSLAGCDALRSSSVSAAPLVRIAFDWTPFETAELDAESRGLAYGHRLHNTQAKLTGSATAGAMWSHVDSGAPGYVDYRLPKGDTLEIPGLMESRPFSVQVVDALGQLLMSEDLTLSTSRTIDLAPAGRKVASLVCKMQWEDESPVGTGQIQLSGSAGQSMGLPFEDGTFRLAPLAAGRLTIEVAATGAKGQSREVRLEAAQAKELTFTLQRAD